MSKTFAPTVPRDERGRLRFPPDQVRRRAVFLPESFEHPARAQLHMIEALVEYLTKPGDLLVDPFGGSGTLLVASLIGRRVGLIELSDEYYDLCVHNAEHMLARNPGMFKPSIQHGPCQDLIPMFQDVNTFIFSPPYAGALVEGGTLSRVSRAQTNEQVRTYMDVTQVQGNLSPYNLGGFNNFMFAQEMKKIYRLCYQALVPGGFCVCIIKDRINAGKKDELGYRAMQDMMAAGFELYDWQRLFMHGSIYTQWHRSKGHEVIDEEHVIMCRKPL